MSHILCEYVTHHMQCLSYRHTHSGRFMLWLEKTIRYLTSYRATPGNPSLLLDGYQRTWQQPGTAPQVPPASLQMLSGAEQQTCSVNQIQELPPTCIWVSTSLPHRLSAYNWKGQRDQHRKNHSLLCATILIDIFSNTTTPRKIITHIWGAQTGSERRRKVALSL